MSLGLPRQQYMVMGQRLGYTARHRDDIQRRSWSDPVARGDNHHRAQLGNTVRVRNFCPDNATELEWLSHTCPCVLLERLGLFAFKPLLGRRRVLGHLRPVDLGRALLGLLLRQELPEQLQVLQGNNGGYIRPTSADDHWVLCSCHPAHKTLVVLDLLRLVHEVRFTEKRVLEHTTTPEKRQRQLLSVGWPPDALHGWR